ncbi:unnamed protein product [Mucor hiemalis]
MGITTFSQNKWGGRSDWSRPSITSTSTTTMTTTELTTNTTTTDDKVPEVKISQPRFSAFGKVSKFTSVQPIKETEEPPAPAAPIAQPRFSVFGKKAKFESINQKSLEQDRKPPTTTTATTTARHINKFELHLSNKSAANSKQQDNDAMTCTTKSRKRGVRFDPLFLEQVCLFRESQCPSDLKEAHDKRSPTFRIICPNWPPQQTSDYQKNILLNKKTFSVQADNTCIKGKLMVRNLALDKSVSIRYTFDNWTTVSDVDGVFFGPNPKNIQFDIYEFAIHWGFGQLSDRGELRGKIEFAIRFTAGNTDYCDNNDGRNYQIKVICDPLNDPWSLENEKKKEEEIKEKDTQEDEEEEEEEEEEDLIIEEEVEEEKHNSFTNALKGYKHARPFHLNKRQPWLGTRYDFSQSLTLAKRAPYESWTVKTDPTSIQDYFLVKPISIKPTTAPITAGPVVEPTLTPSSSTTTTSFNIIQPSSSLVSFNNRPQMVHTSSTPTSSYSKPTFMFSSASAPPSPRVSPTLSSASPIRPTLHPSSHSTSAAIPTLTTSASPLDINSSYYLELVDKYCFYNGNQSDKPLMG